MGGGNIWSRKLLQQEENQHLDTRAAQMQQKEIQQEVKVSINSVKLSLLFRPSKSKAVKSQQLEPDEQKFTDAFSQHFYNTSPPKVNKAKVNYPAELSAPSSCRHTGSSFQTHGETCSSTSPKFTFIVSQALVDTRSFKANPDTVKRRFSPSIGTKVAAFRLFVLSNGPIRAIHEMD